MDSYKHQATSDDLRSLGWHTEDGKYWMSLSGAWYSTDELFVVEYAWIDGKRLPGPWLVVESMNPLSERYCERLSR